MESGRDRRRPLPAPGPAGRRGAEQATGVGRHRGPWTPTSMSCHEGGVLSAHPTRHANDVAPPRPLGLVARRGGRQSRGRPV